MAVSTLGVTSRSCSVALATQSRARSVVPVSRPASKLRVQPIVAFLGDKRSKDQGSKGALGKGKAALNTASGKGKAALNTASGKGKGALNTASRTGKKQPVIQPLGKAPTNKKEEAESVLWGVAVFGLFVTGVLFVTIPAFQVGGTSFTNSWQKGVNKSVGIKKPAIADPGYAPGPGPIAAPESPAAQM